MALCTKTVPGTAELRCPAAFVAAVVLDVGRDLRGFCCTPIEIDSNSPEPEEECECTANGCPRIAAQRCDPFCKWTSGRSRCSSRYRDLVDSKTNDLSLQEMTALLCRSDAEISYLNSRAFVSYRD